MKERLRKHHISFKNAFSGLKYAFITQPNFLIHGTLSLLALLVGIFLKITAIEMTIIVLTIIIGFIAEMINTAIESVTDLVTTEWQESARIAKDVSAGMMLLTAIGATLIALVIFFPYIIRLFTQ